MALPHATALEITARDLAPKGNPTAFRKQLFPRQKPPLALVSSTRVVAPLWQNLDTWFRSHVDAWLEHNSAPMRSFIKRRCFEEGYSYLDVTSTSRRRVIIVAKHTLLYEVWLKFKPSYPELAALFNLTDHTSALHIVQKFERHGKATFNMPKHHAEEIQRLWRAGGTTKEIAVETGCCDSSVYAFIKTQDWTR